MPYSGQKGGICRLVCYYSLAVQFSYKDDNEDFERVFMKRNTIQNKKMQNIINFYAIFQIFIRLAGKGTCRFI